VDFRGRHRSGSHAARQMPDGPPRAIVRVGFTLGTSLLKPTRRPIRRANWRSSLRES
jgi:hypothetical protein